MSADVALPHNTVPGRTGQGTEIEKSRAAAEVYYRVAAAKELPRDEHDATLRMREACANYELAKVAFYSVPKGSDRATGPSVHLARELARIWGNLDYGVVELRRDDEYGQSEMQAFAWDLQTNTRPSSLWIQPHKIDLKGGRVKHLTSVQEIYESNANAGARRVREAIFAVMSRVFVDEAQRLCRETLERGDGTPLPERRRVAVEAFAREFKVTEEQLVARLHRAVHRWDEQDVADLQVLFGSLRRREVQVDVEFPPAGSSVTLDEARGVPAADDQPVQDAEPLDPDEQEIADQLRRERELAEQDGGDQ